ncbi:hypothetical protein AYI70_g673, partial [Smittium culicis]
MQISADQIVEAEFSYASLKTENEQLKQQLSNAEDQYNQLVSEKDSLNKHISKQDADIALLKEQLESEVKARTELYMHYQEEKIQIISREKDLAVKEADFYRRQAEEAVKPNPIVNVDSKSYSSVQKIPKIPEFSGSTVGFPRWVSW